MPAAALSCPVHPLCRGDARGRAELDAQRQRRLEVLGRALGTPVAPPAPAPPARARAALRPLPDGRRGPALPGAHELRPLHHCALLHPRLNEALPHLPPMPPGLAELELRTDGQRLVAAARARHPGRDPRLADALRALELPVDGLALDGRPLRGEVELRVEVEGIVHHLGPSTFYQVHLEVNRALVGRVRALVHEHRARAVLDLFAGCGNLGLPLARDGLSVCLIESHAPALADARRTAARHGLAPELRRADANAFRAGDAFFDLAILDPPRAGAPGLTGQLALTRPGAIIMLSCTPALLARDLGPALAQGYRLQLVEAFDMFPGTEHLEVLAVLERAQG